MKIEDILEIENNELNMKELKEKSKELLVPFIGAGISRGYGYMDWREFLNFSVEKYLIKDSAKQIVYQLIQEKKYYEAAEYIDIDLNHGLNEVIRNTFGIHTLRNKKLNQGVLNTLCKLNSNLLITTNYDYLIEEVYKANSKVINSLALSSHVINTHIKTGGKGGLLKLHGEIGDFNSLIITKKQYEKYYGGLDVLDDDADIPRAISVLWRTCTLLFLGCSLEQDITVKKMKSLAGQDLDNSHFAVVEMPDNLDEQIIKNNQFIQLKIRPIWYPKGKHDYVELILEELVDESENMLFLTYESMKDLSIQEIYEYAAKYNQLLHNGKESSAIYHTMGLLNLRLGDYSQALMYFERVNGVEKADAFFYSAISLLKGKKAFLASRAAINQIEDYMQRALSLKNKASYYYFWAYIKYDYFVRKSYRTSPNYKEYMNTAYNLGITKGDIEELFAVLQVQRPAEL